MCRSFFSSDLPARKTFASKFLARIEVENKWQWKTFWIDEAHFHLTKHVNTQNCRNMGYRKSTGNSTCTTSFCKGHCVVRICGIIYHRAIFFQETSALAPIFVTVIGQCCKCPLRNHVISVLQQCRCVDGIICMEDRASSLIAILLNKAAEVDFRNC